MADETELQLGIDQDKFAAITKRLHVGGKPFEDATREKKLLIDKSLFIKYFFGVADDCVAILRPRRFGKSLNLSMLKCFLDQQVKDQISMFEDLAIMKEEEVVEEHLGKYPVVFLSLKDCKSDNWEEMRLDIWEALCDMIKPHADAQTVEMADLIHREFIEKSSPYDYPFKAPDVMIGLMLKKLIYRLHMFHERRKVIVIVDEYDAPMNVVMKQEEDSERRRKFLEKFFSSALKDNTAVAKACLAGIYHVKGASILSGVNNIGIFSIDDTSPMASCFGFSENEVQSFLIRAFDADERKVHDLWARTGGIKDWYNGYCIGKHSLINPYGFMKFVSLGFKFASYWAKTSSTKDLFNILEGDEMNSNSLMEVITRVMKSNGRIEVPQLDTELDISNMLQWSKDETVHFLCMTGYLTYQPVNSEVPRGEAWIPNKEIMIEWRKLTTRLSGFQSDKEVNDTAVGLALAFKKFDFENIKEYMTRAIKQIANRSSGKEHIYQHYIGGLLSVLTSKDCFSNCETGAGDGFADQIVSFKDMARSVIIECKHTKGGSDNLDELAGKALKQIIDRKYLSIVPIGYDALLVGCAIGEFDTRQVSFLFQVVAADELKASYGVRPGCESCNALGIRQASGASLFRAPLTTRPTRSKKSKTQ